jgi:predicted ATP-grasp superfamily ATP-dependent carboligase
MVVLRSNDCCFLGIARGCAAAGIPIVPVVFDWPGSGPWYSETSPLVADPVRIPNPYQFAGEACEAMVELGRSLLAEWGERLMVVPSSDTNLMFLLDHYDRLAPYFRVAGDRDFDASCLEVVRKDTAAERFAAAGVPIPLTLACLKPGDVEPVARAMTYPCVYKPVAKDYGQSFYAAHGGLKAIECHDPDELCERLEEEIDAGFELVVQQKVAFGSVEEEIPFYLYADREHRIRMAATGIKEQIQPPPYGTATVLRLAWHEELLPLAQQVVEALEWRGILMIEFIRDRNDGVWKVIEVNARPWLCVDFYRRSGLNYLQYLYEDWQGEHDAWPDLVTPDARRLETSSVHLNLPASTRADLRAVDGDVTIDDVIRSLRAVEGARSLTFLDPGDPEPGRAELRALAAEHGLDGETLIERVVQELCDD